MPRYMTSKEAEQAWCPKSRSRDEKCLASGCAVWVKGMGQYAFDPAPHEQPGDLFWHYAWDDISYCAERTGNERVHEYEQQKSISRTFLQWLFRRPKILEKEKKSEKQHEWRKLEVGRCGAFDLSQNNQGGY